MSVRIDTADLESYLNLVRGRLGEARDALGKLDSEVCLHRIVTGTFNAAVAFHECYSERVNQYQARLQRYVTALEGLEEAVMSIIANWEDSDSAVESYFGEFDDEYFKPIAERPSASDFKDGLS